MTIKKNMIGGHHLSYTCPKCGDALRSPLTEAGSEQTCPQCGTTHTVPGKEQVAKFLLAKKQQKEKEEAAREAELQRREAAHEKQRREWRGGFPMTNLTDEERRADTKRQAMAAQRQRDNLVDGMISLAACVCSVGAGCLFYFAFVYKVMVTVTVPTAVGNSTSHVVNLGLLQNRLIGCHVGIALMCTGLILLGLTAILFAVRKGVGEKP
jgi:uncharacterized Zn finger protein (UPF0148 family)